LKSMPTMFDQASSKDSTCTKTGQRKLLRVLQESWVSVQFKPGDGGNRLQDSHPHRQHSTGTSLSWSGLARSAKRKQNKHHVWIFTLHFTSRQNTTNMRITLTCAVVDGSAAA
jgi:hypothetical protein